LKDNTIRGILNRVIWSGDIRRASYDIVVVDRLNVNGFRKYKLNEEVKVLNDRLIINDTIIPYHRVVAILKDGDVIWKRSAYQIK